MKLNILIRTHHRPVEFKRCIEKIKSQTDLEDVKLVISYEDDRDLQYINTVLAGSKLYYNTIKVPDKDQLELTEKPGKNLYEAKYNLYHNYMYPKCEHGYIMFTDDDGNFINKDAIKIIKQFTLQNHYELLFWRVAHPIAGVVPPMNLLGQEPQYGKICGSGFAFHTKHIKNAQWDSWSGGDYRVAKNLFNKVNNNRIHFINTILNAPQGMPGHGK